MFKFNHHVFKRTINNLKHHVHRSYHHVKNIAGHIDHGISIAKDAYKILEPVINTYAGHHSGHIHSHALKALSGYESLRNNVLDANHHATTVGSKLSGLI